MQMRAILLSAILALTSCGATDAPQQRRETADLTSLPPMKVFAGPRVTAPNRSNADIARDFLDLSFQLESGRALPVLTRFEGPITLRVLGRSPDSLDADLGRLLARFRSEARIDIGRVAPDRPASITVQIVSRDQLQRAVPEAACFVVPRVTSWKDFTSNRRGAALDWTTLTTRERLSIFIPGDVPPQEVRDCLHEELAQALGPLNDLYRLTDSVFNDDNFHTVLTGFDMLILRATYAPELASGMSRAEVARRLSAVLSRMNPAGDTRASAPRPASTRAWMDQIELALGSHRRDGARRAAAERAVQLARAARWNDNRLALSLFALGRLSIESHPDISVTAFFEAAELYDRDPDTDIHAAHVAMQLAAFTLSSGDAPKAIAIIDRNLDAVERAENASLLSTLLLLKSAALRDLGRSAEADRLQAEALGWSRYGHGDTEEVLRRAEGIAALFSNTGDPAT